MIRRLIRNPRFILGFIVLACLLISSFALTNMTVPKANELQYGSNHEVTAVAPFPPSAQHWFGTNDQGEDELFLVIQGVKYTIGYALAVAICRLLISTALGILYGLYAKKSRRLFQAFIRPFRFIPAVLLALIFLTLLPGIWLSLLVTIFIAVPVLTEIIGEDVRHQLQQEHIIPSKLMGASRFHLLRKHLWPFLAPRLTLHFLQQIAQVLLLMLHLGILEITLFQTYDLTYYISNFYTKLMTTTWEIYTPVLVFFLLLCSFQLLVKGVESVLSAPPLEKRPLKVTTPPAAQPVPLSFKFMK
ncbi:oligopeptide transport system, permease [Fictibacillus macauensis ZFHKF-1]|uniref:Oligopeptide transport system, permease n=1 Tax=Fictibacillus macauensis ZFHKF-1 TaxID=1196324 RepID=I8UC00_9BACL|nr:ABC transporter permease subunit [Fictibacillus macauensis]EIT84323.1 oligopeptide transport system, permease [Fictibacillus macauensis ZFHKF-1]